MMDFVGLDNFRLDLHRLEDKIKNSKKRKDEHIQIFQDVLKPFSEIAFEDYRDKRFGEREQTKIRQVSRVLKLCRVRVMLEGHVAEKSVYETGKEDKAMAKSQSMYYSEIATAEVKKALVEDGCIAQRLETKSCGFKENVAQGCVRIIILSVDPKICEIIEMRHRRRGEFAKKFETPREARLGMVFHGWFNLVWGTQEKKSRGGDTPSSSRGSRRDSPRRQSSRQSSLRSSTQEPMDSRSKSPRRSLANAPKSEVLAAAHAATSARRTSSTRSTSQRPSLQMPQVEVDERSYFDRVHDYLNGAPNPIEKPASSAALGVHGFLNGTPNNRAANALQEPSASALPSKKSGECCKSGSSLGIFGGINALYEKICSGAGCHAKSHTSTIESPYDDSEELWRFKEADHDEFRLSIRGA